MASSTPESSEQPLYDLRFWLSYLSNMAFVVSGSILVRYSDFVLHRLGGNELDLGLITGFGVCGAIVLRLLLGRWIDRVGAAVFWQASLVIFIAGLLLHLMVTDPRGPAVYVARLLTTTATAGVFGASITFVTLRVPTRRVAEAVGVLGSSGFLGLALGPVVVDALLGPRGDAAVVPRMFYAASLAGAVALLCSLWATFRAPVAGRKASRPIPLLPLLRRYQPVRLLLVGTAMGLGIGLPQVFLRPFVEERGLGGVQTFFVTYALVAFTVRLLARDVNQRFGSGRVILLGTGLLALSVFAYLPVSHPATLMLPAAIGGLAHAFIFPAVVGASTIAFPVRYRGTATTLILTSLDLGLLIVQPLTGLLVTLARGWGWPPYHAAFLVIGTLLAAGTVAYGWMTPRGAAEMRRHGATGPLVVRRRRAA